MVLADGAQAQSAAPTASPVASPAPKPPTARALAVAAGMRAFDSELTDAQVQKIASAIDDNAKAARALAPKKKPLRNSDEPVTTFAVEAP